MRENFEYPNLPNMRRKKLDCQLSLKCAEPLFAELSADAERLGVPLSEAARRALVDWAARRVVDRERVTAPAHAETMQQ